MAEYVSNFGGSRIHTSMDCSKLLPGNVRPPTEEERARMRPCKNCERMAERELIRTARAIGLEAKRQARLAAISTIAPPERRSKIVTTVYLEPSQYEGIVRASVECGRTSAELLREAVSDWLAKRVEVNHA